MGIKDGLIGYWTMDENSGTRYDSHNDYDLDQSGGTLTGDKGGRVSW